MPSLVPTAIGRSKAFSAPNPPHVGDVALSHRRQKLPLMLSGAVLLVGVIGLVTIFLLNNKDPNNRPQELLSTTTPAPRELVPTVTPEPIVRLNLLEKVDWTEAITDLDCDGSSPPNTGIQVDELQFADMTGDGKAEAFVAASCVSETASLPSRLDVFDGASDPLNPRRIATLLDYKDGPAESSILIGTNRGSDPTPSISISGSIVTVISAGYDPKDEPCCPSLQITDTFIWNGNGFNRSQRSVAQAANNSDGRKVINKILRAVHEAKSYKTTITTTSGMNDASVTVNAIFVAPNMSSSIGETDGAKLYEIVIGANYYISKDGTNWVESHLDTSDPRLGDLGNFSLQVAPSQTVELLADQNFEGRNVGVVRLMNKDPSQKLILRYDKQNYRLLQLVGEEVIDGHTLSLEGRIYDYDSTDNKVESPSVK